LGGLRKNLSVRQKISMEMTMRGGKTGSGDNEGMANREGKYG